MRKRCKDVECPLIERKEVGYSGSLKSEVVVCGESPGAEEEKRGRPFVGSSGILAKEVAKQAGLEWKGFFIINSARCRILKDELSGKDITKTLAHCRKHVELVMRSVKPKLILILGDFALRQILRRKGIKKAQGRWVWSEEFSCWAFSTYHPAYILRNPGLKNVLIEDFKQVADFIENDFQMAKATGDLDYRDAVDLRDELKEGDIIGIDTECQGLDWSSTNWRLLSVSISNAEGMGRNVNLYQECEIEDADFTIEWPRKVNRKLVIMEVGVRACDEFDKKVDGLVWALENKKIRKVMMNGNFDLHAFRSFFSRLGREVTVAGYVLDVQAAAHVLDENIFKMSSLEELQRFFTDYDFDYNRIFDEKYSKADMLSVPMTDRSEYACADADVTRRIAVSELGKLKEEPRLANYYFKMVHPTLTKSLYSLERNGAWIDRDALPEATENVRQAAEKEHEKAVAQAPVGVKRLELHESKGLKLTRTDFVRDTLFHEEGFGLRPVKRTKGGKQPSVDKESRATLLGGKLRAAPRKFLEHYSEWSELHTLWSRYLKGFDKHIKTDGRIHSSMSLTVAVTGRVASSGPNMQNNPKRSKSAHMIRKLIAAPVGWELLAVDQSQAELRWAAHVANAKSMIRVFRNNEDIHTNTARSMVDWARATEKAREEARRKAKTVNFGMLFLMTAPGLVQYAKNDYGVVMSERQAGQYIKGWFGMYPELRTYHRRTIEFGRRMGYVESPLGRRRHLPELAGRDQYLRSAAERQAVNHPIQAPSSDTVLIAANEMTRKGMLNPEEILLVLFIHDELVFQIKKDVDVAKYATMIKHEMENPPLERFGVKLRVPLVADLKVGPNLAEMKELTI